MDTTHERFASLTELTRELASGLRLPDLPVTEIVWPDSPLLAYYLDSLTPDERTEPVTAGAFLSWLLILLFEYSLE
jgi:hypothetical protein